MRNVLVTITIEATAFNRFKACKWREIATQWMRFEFFQQGLRHVFDAGFVIWVTNVDDLTIALVVAVFNNAEQGFDAVLNIGETTFLRSTINQLDRSAFDQVQDQLRDGTRATDTR